MARLRYNGMTATLGAALASGDTTITFAAALSSAAGAVPTIAGTDYIPLVILTSTNAVSEIVYLTAYTSGATTGTITRAREGTTATGHASGDAVVNALTVADVDSPQCRGYLTANMALPDSTVTVIPLDGETYDSAGMHSTTTSNSRITIGADGSYLIVGCVQHQAASGQLQTRIHKNGAQYGIAFGVGSSAGTAPVYTDVVPLVAGDYLELAAYQASGAASNVYGGSVSTYLIVKKLL